MRNKSLYLFIIIFSILFCFSSCSFYQTKSMGEDGAEAHKNRETLLLAGKPFTLGMSQDELAQPDEVLRSCQGFRWLVYGTESYKNFYAVGVKNQVVVALASSGSGFEYRGVKAGNIITPSSELAPYLYVDENDNNKVHAVLITSLNAAPPNNRRKLTKEGLRGEAKLNFHLTNAFRVYHKLPILKWSNRAAKAARLHSEDMGRQNYFEHEDLNGGFAIDRMSNQGIIALVYAENIAAGYSDGFQSYCAWISSAEHRVNVLGDFTSLGVGMAYADESKYGYYQTQNFFSTKSAEKEPLSPD